jgi:predicted short-subunit dehydrogenase-like oxidoreductase (DUF2520 family)
MRISFIGNGNLAQNLSLILKGKGYTIVEVFARNREALDLFCKTIEAKPIYDLKDLSNDVDLVVISISDDAIPEVLKFIPHMEVPIVHTSGSVSIEVFKETGFKNYGVLYPLYSFSKENYVDFKSIPFLLEYNTEKSKDLIESIAKDITDTFAYVNSEDRAFYHLSAIFINNFSNFIMGTAQELATEKNLDFEFLRPILLQTANNAYNSDRILSLQTGPARRNNVAVIEKHKGLLAKEPITQDLYMYLTKKIIEKFS